MERLTTMVQKGEYFSDEDIKRVFRCDKGVGVRIDYVLNVDVNVRIYSNIYTYRRSSC